MSSTILGIDIGSSSLKLSTKSGNSIRCYDPFPLPDNLIRNNKIVSAEVMAGVIRQAVKINHIHLRNCAVILPTDTAFIRHISLPMMSADQLDINLPNEFNDYIPKDGKGLYYFDYAVDGYINGPDGKPEKMELLAAAVAKKTISEYFTIMGKAGLKVEAAIPEIFAYRNIIRRDQQNSGGKVKQYCIIDLGHTSIRMHIFNGISYETTRVIDYGGQLLTDILKDYLKVDEHIAIQQFRMNQKNVQASEPCKQFYRNIAIEVKRAIDFYSYYKSMNSIDEVYYCGGLAYCKELIRVIRENLGINMTDFTKTIPIINIVANTLEDHLAIGTLLQ